MNKNQLRTLTPRAFCAPTDTLDEQTESNAPHNGLIMLGGRAEHKSWIGALSMAETRAAHHMG
jgi:hypothetical protein